MSNLINFFFPKQSETNFIHFEKYDNSSRSARAIMAQSCFGPGSFWPTLMG